MKGWNNESQLPSPLVSPKVKLEWTRRERAEEVRAEHFTLHRSTCNYGLQRRLERQLNERKLHDLEEEIRLLAQHRLPRYRRPAQKPGPLPPPVDLESNAILELRQGAQQLKEWVARGFDRTHTDTTTVSLQSKLMSPTDRNSTQRPSELSFKSPGQFGQTQQSKTQRSGVSLPPKVGVDLTDIKRFRLNSTLTPSRASGAAESRAGPVFNECEEEVRVPVHLRDLSPLTPCPTIDFPVLGGSLSPSSRAGRRHTYWKQRVLRDFAPRINQRTQALNEVRTQSKEPRRLIRRVRLDELSR